MSMSAQNRLTIVIAMQSVSTAMEHILVPVTKVIFILPVKFARKKNPAFKNDVATFGVRMLTSK